MKRLFLSFLLLYSMAFQPVLAISYSWNGSVSSEWNNAANWTPTGVPSGTDDVVIPAKPFVPLLPDNRTVTAFSISSGSINLGGYTLTITGNAAFTKGTISNGNISASGASTVFGNYSSATSGVIMDAIVSVNSSTVSVNYSTFHQKATFIKNGGWLDNSAGGNTFNDSTFLTLYGTGSMRFGWNAKDTFNGVLTLTNHSSPNGMSIGRNNHGHAYNNDVYVNSTNGGSVNIDNGSMANAKTIRVGSVGFYSGYLYFINFVQLGSTPQTLILAGIANGGNNGGRLRTEGGTVFNGDVHFKAYNLLITGCTFNGAATLEQTVWRNGVADGGVFSSTITPLNSQGYTITPTAPTSTATVYNGPALIISTSGEGFALGNRGGPEGNRNIFNGDAELINLGGNILRLSHYGNDLFNGNLRINSLSNPGIYFGATGYTTTIAVGKTLTVGNHGFHAGMLTLKGFLYQNPSPPALNLTGTASMRIATGSLFKGNIHFTVPHLYLDGGTFEKAATFIKTVAGVNNSYGGNLYKGKLYISNTATGTSPLNLSTAIQDQIFY